MKRPFFSSAWKRAKGFFTQRSRSTSGSASMPSKEGFIPFVVDGETHQTWFKVFGDLAGTASGVTPLVVIHGGPGLSHDYLLPIQDVAAKRPVIFYDQIGNGRSTHLRDKPSTFWTVALFVDELHNLIQHFKISDKFDLIGHSWGGVVATEYAVQRAPAGLQHMILSDSLAAMGLWMQSNMQLASEFPSDVQAGLAAGFSNLPKYRAALDQFHAVHGCTVKPFPELIKHSFDLMLADDGDPTVPIAMFTGALANWTIIDRLHLVAVPTLVINGRADIAQDFVVAPFFTNIKTVKWVTFENSSHTPMWEERERYMKVVEEFVDL